MDALTFIQRYPHYLESIRSVIKEEYYPIIDNLGEIDPHDLVTPDTWFADNKSAFGFVWALFQKELKNE